MHCSGCLLSQWGNDFVKQNLSLRVCSLQNGLNLQFDIRVSDLSLSSTDFGIAFRYVVISAVCAYELQSTPFENMHGSLISHQLWLCLFLSFCKLICFSDSVYNISPFQRHGITSVLGHMIVICYISFLKHCFF